MKLTESSQGESVQFIPAFPCPAFHLQLFSWIHDISATDCNDSNGIDQRLTRKLPPRLNHLRTNVLYFGDQDSIWERMLYLASLGFISHVHVCMMPRALIVTQDYINLWNISVLSRVHQCLAETLQLLLKDYHLGTISVISRVITIYVLLRDYSYDFIHLWKNALSFLEFI